MLADHTALALANAVVCAGAFTAISVFKASANFKINRWSAVTEAKILMLIV